MPNLSSDTELKGGEIVKKNLAINCLYDLIILKAPIPQNGQTHSNNSLPVSRQIV